MTKTTYLCLLISLFAVLGVAKGNAPEEAGAAKAQECLRKAFETARAIEKRQLLQESLEKIARDQACAGDLAGAQRAAEVVLDANGAARILAAIADAQAKQGDRDAAKATLDEAMKRASQISPQERGSPFLSIVHAYVATGELSEAERTASRYLSDFHRCSAMVKIAEAYLSSGRRDEAKALAQEVAATYEAHVDDFNISWLSVREWLWPLYLQLDEVAEALQFARSIPAGNYQRCRALCAIGEHKAKKGDVKAASAIFAEAFQAAKEIEDRSVAECQMEGVVYSQIVVSDLHGAWKTLQGMPDCYHKVMAFQRIVSARAKAGDRAAARSAMEQALGIAEQMQDVRSKAAALTSLARGEADIGDEEAAKDTAAKAFQAACQIDYGVLRFTEVAKVQTLIGDRPAARKTLEEALRRADEIVDAPDKSFEVRLIAKTQITAGLPKKAQVTVRERLLPLLPLSEPWPDGYEEAATLLAAAGDLEGAYETAKKVTEGVRSRAFAMRKVIAHQTMAKGPGEALLLADKEGDPVLQSSMYHGIAVGLLKTQGIEAPSFREIASID